MWFFLFTGRRNWIHTCQSSDLFLNSYFKNLGTNCSTHIVVCIRNVWIIFAGIKVLIFFFSIWVFFQERSQFTEQQGKEEAPVYRLHPLHRHLDISWAITVENSPLHIASSRTLTGNLWFPSASRWPLSYVSFWGSVFFFITSDFFVKFLSWFIFFLFLSVIQVVASLGVSNCDIILCQWIFVFH